MRWLCWLFGDRAPEGFSGDLAADEQVIASAEVESGGHIVVTALGLWVPESVAYRRIGWHLMNKVVWKDGGLTVTEAEELGNAGAATLLADRAPVRYVLAKPGKVPKLVRQRVDNSIRSRYHKDLPGGGAWFVQRKLPGRDGTVLQVRADPGTDSATVADIAREAAAKLASPNT